jgi:hypothetical protein
MIFDWVKNSERVLMAGKLLSDDKWDRRHFYQQQECLVYFMIVERNKNTSAEKPFTKIDHLEKTWESIMAKSDKDFRYLTPSARKSDFTTLMRRAYYLESEFTQKREKDIPITRSEINYINSLQAPRWFRKYVLLILAYYKFQKEYDRTAFIPKEISSWAYEQARSSERVAQNRIHKSNLWPQNAKCGKPIMVKPVSGKVGLVIEWASRDGLDAAFSFKTPDEVVTHFERIDSWMAVCPRCGSSFEASNKQKSDLCPECKRAKSNERSRDNRKIAKKKISCHR